MLGTLLLAGAAALAAPATDSTNAVRQVTAYRLSAAVGAPTLDGRLDDAVWAAADTIGGFTQREPNEGQPSRYRTVMRVAFDNDAVYVAARAYDPEPAKISAQLTRRDEDSSSDWLFVGFDSRHDRRTAYVFAVNPAGVKRDMTIADGANDDTGWDAVWSVAVGRDSLGWTAEYRIPLSALRFATGGDGVWGFQAVRVVQRDNERSSWTRVTRDEPRHVARFGELRGLSGLPAPRRLELLPYTVSGVTRAPGDAANPFYSSSEMRGSAGLDVKYGVTSNLTLDATFNPDFGQVEADPSEVNLSAFETFPSERRPFFTEGADIFRFGIGLGDGDGGQRVALLLAPGRARPARRRGRAGRRLRGPAGADEHPGRRQAERPDRARLVDRGDERPHRRGARHRPRCGRRARRPGGGADDQLQRHPRPPRAERRQDAVRRGDHGRRAAAGRHGDGLAPLARLRRRRRRAAPLGERHVLGAPVGAGLAHRGEHGGDPERAGLQRALLPAPRPELPPLRLGGDLAGGVGGELRRGQGEGEWQGGFLGSIRSPGFETNDLGFQRAADEIVNVFWMQHNQRTPGKVFRDWNLGGNAWDARNFGWERTRVR
jgi:hypothetical protein